MGLDMYMMKVNRTNHSIEELLKIDENASPDNPTCKDFEVREYQYLKGVYSIFHEVAYWRKFNALHNWMVKFVQNGTDDCGYYKLYNDTLTELYNVLLEVHNTKNADLLPPVSGFFFGSTNIDQWYWDNVEESVEVIGEILNNFDWDKYDLYYTSSW